MKKISLIIIFTLVLTVTSPLCDAYASQIPLIDDDFGGYAENTVFEKKTNSPKGVWHTTADPKSGIFTIGGNQVLALNQYKDDGTEANNVTRYLFNTPVYETDENYRIKLEYDICPDMNNLDTSTYLRFIMADGKEAYCAMFNGGKLHLGEWGGSTGNSEGTYNKGEYWYHVEAVADLKTDTSDIVVTEKSTGKRVGIQAASFNTGNGTDNRFTATECKGISIWAKGTKNSRIYIDNVKVTPVDKKQEIPLEPGAELMLMSEDFEAYENSADAFQPWTSEESWYERAIIDGTSAEDTIVHSEIDLDSTYGKVLKIRHHEGINNTAVIKLFPEQSFRKIKLTFDIKNTEGLTNLIHLENQRGHANMLTFSSDGNVYLMDYHGKNDALIGTYSFDTWYHCEIEIDLTEQTMNYSIVGGEHSYKGYNKDITRPLKLISTSLPIARGIRNQVWGTKGKAAYLDNIKVYIVPEFTIIPEEDDSKPPSEDETVPNVHSIKFYTDGTESEITSATDEVRVNFGTEMDEDSLKNVQIKDISNNKILAYQVINNSDNTYSFDLSNERFADKLSPGCEYSLTIPNGVKSLSGAEISAPLIMNFTTEKAEVTANIEAVTYNGDTPVLVDLQKDGELKTKISYTNNSGSEERATLMYCYYSQNELKDVEVKEINLNANVTDGEIGLNHMIKSLTENEIDKISVILWNGQGAKPLSQNFININ